MNPRQNLEDCDTETARACVTLFERCKDSFQFAIDGTPDEKEVRGGIIESDSEYDGRSTIVVTAINEPSKFNTIVSTAKEMGLNVETEQSEETDEYIGDYTAYVLTAFAPSGISAAWNVPHLVVYGSLRPEVEECIYTAFLTQISCANIRNHFIVYGERLGESAKSELADAVQNSNEFFSEDKRDILSDIHTADFI